MTAVSTRLRQPFYIPGILVVTPDMVVEMFIDTLNDRHLEYLAAIERQAGIAAETLEPMRVDHLAAEGLRIKTDRPPVALVGIAGTSASPELNRHSRLDFVWTLAVEVFVMGVNREDTLRRRDWYGMTSAACLVQLVSRRANPIDTVALVDVELTEGTDQDTQASLGMARLLLDVRVRDTMSVLPMNTTKPADPYAAPGRLPLVEAATTTVTKEPLA